MNYKSISLISGTLLLSTLSANGQKKDSKPNIIFILCDDMGYGDLGCYGQPFIRTPPYRRYGKRRNALHTSVCRQPGQRTFQSFIYDRTTYRSL